MGTPIESPLLRVKHSLLALQSRLLGRVIDVHANNVYSLADRGDGVDDEMGERWDEVAVRGGLDEGLG